jgi:short-subunit dehydrogenase
LTSSLEANCVFYKVDITSGEEINAVAEKLRNEHGDPTVLINNAGFGSATPLLQVPENVVRKVFDVNIISHFLLVKEFLPAMVDRNHGHVVTVASMGSFMTQASNVDYACTKAAALAFHEGINQELKILYNAPSVRTTYVNPLPPLSASVELDSTNLSNLMVSIIHPSWVRTPMISKLSNNPAFKASILEPEHVAHAIVSQILSGYGGQIILPEGGSWVSSVRGFPLWLQEKLRTQVSMVLTEVVGK